MNLSEFLRTFFQVVYSINYDTFLSIFKMEAGYYSKEKFRFMQSDFPGWYLSLDFNNSEKFVNYVKERIRWNS